MLLLLQKKFNKFKRTVIRDAEAIFKIKFIRYRSSFVLIQLVTFSIEAGSFTDMWVSIEDCYRK